MDEIYIPESERFEYTQALSILLEFGELGVPLPVIFGELYPERRIVLYSTKEMTEKFVKTISSFLFYRELNIVCYSDETFFSEVRSAIVGLGRLIRGVTGK